MDGMGLPERCEHVAPAQRLLTTPPCPI